MNNENDIIEGKFEELESVQKDVSEISNGNSNDTEYRFKNTKKSKKKKGKPFRTVLLAGVVGVGCFYAGNLYSKYDISISFSEKGIDKEVTPNAKMNADETTVEEDTTSELVFNNEEEKVEENTKESSSDVNPIQEASNSVVSISSKSISGQGALAQLGESAGSGIIVKEDDEYIYMLTNNHVVEGGAAFEVSLDDETYVEAKVLGTDSVNDVAVIYSLKENFEEAGIDYSIAKIGDSDDLQLTDKVYAIGNSAGEGKSVTSGVVSALNKKVEFSDGSTNEFIQTDAAINPGNSGGALVDENGYLVGMNTAKLVDSSIEGMGYSIPINDALQIAEDLVTKPFMGIQGASVSDLISEDVKALGLPEGVYVDSVVVGSGADKSGIKGGDIITQMDNTEITNFDDLGNYLSDCQIGDEVDVTVYRSGEYLKLNLVLGSRASY